MVDARSWTTGDGPKAIFNDAVAWLLDRRVLLPGVTTLARLVAQVRDDATQRLWDALYELLGAKQRAILERLLEVPEGARFSDLERWRKGPAQPSGKNLEKALSRMAEITAVGLGKLDLAADTSTAVRPMFFQILGAIAEFEHALMSERTRDGLEAARGRGRTGGQKPKLTARQAKIAQDMYDELGPDGRRTHTVPQIAEEFGVTRPTIYRHLQARTA